VEPAGIEPATSSLQS